MISKGGIMFVTQESRNFDKVLTGWWLAVLAPFKGAHH
jgi:hypothetical protein